MPDAQFAPADLTHAAPGLAPLRARIGWLCHAIRLASLVWIAWIVVEIARHWSSPQMVAANFGRYLKLDLGTLPPLQYAAALTIVLIALGLGILLAIYIWKLFGLYLQGEIFTVRAATVMRSLGLIGLGAALFDIVSRPLIIILMTAHMPAGSKSVGIWAQPNDLLHLLIAGFIFALAHIFKTAAEIAEDNAQIV